MKVFLRLDKKTHTLEVYPKDTLKALKVKLTDKAGVPPYQISLYFCGELLVCLFVCLFICLFVCLFICLFVCLLVYVFVHLFVYLFICLFVHLFVYLFTCLLLFVGRELDDNRTLEQENIVNESTIEVILIQSFGDFVKLSVVSQINPSLKEYIQIEEGKKVAALKEEICKLFHCLPEKQHLTAVNERRPEKTKYLSDMNTIWTYELDHEYKIYVYYEFEGTITFKHRISSGIYKLKIKSNSTIRQIKDKIREEIQIGTVTEIYNQNNVKLSNDTSLADNHVTPADVLEIELLGKFRFE